MFMVEIRDLRATLELPDRRIAEVDRSGFQKQFVPGRSMAQKGVKKVQRKVLAPPQHTHTRVSTYIRRRTPFTEIVRRLL